MKICLVHDWLTSYGGAELVLKTMLEIWPDAPIFTLVYDPEGPCREIIQSTQVHGSFINKFQRAKRNHRSFLPVMPLAIEQFDLSDFDIVLSSSHAVAKGVITGPDQLHISYVHTPIRYAWDLQSQYLADAGLTRGLKSWLARALLHYIRIWDERTVPGVDHYIANSKFVAQRIWKHYKREATVIHPPVELDRFTTKADKKDFYLTVSRLVPYKKIDLIVEAFRQMPDKKLVVIGDGPEMKAIKERQTPNIDLRGFLDNETIAATMQDAKALVFAAEEDFGIVPVEAQACGTPVIAYGKGGALETVRDGETGFFFAEQSPESIIGAIKAFEVKPKLNYEQIRENAERFAKKRFKTILKTFVDSRYHEFRQTESRHINGIQEGSPTIRHAPWIRTNTILIVSDLLTASIAILLATLIRQLLIPLMGGVVSWPLIFNVMLFYIPFTIILSWLTGLYPGSGLAAVQEMQKVLYVVTLSSIFLGVLLFLQQVSGAYSR